MDGRRLLLVLVALLAMIPRAARAHVPHDVALHVAISPAYADDGLVIAVVQLTDHPLLARSEDGGRSWTVYAAPILYDGTARLRFSPGFAHDRTVFAACRSGVWISLDGGLRWEPRDVGLPADAVTDVAVSPGFVADGTLLAATHAGLFRSTDRGALWLPVVPGPAEAQLEHVAFAPDGGGVAFAAGAGVHRSDDGGLSWALLETFGGTVASLAVAPDVATSGALAVAFGRPGGGVQVSTDGGASWQAAAAGLTDPRVNDVAIAADGTTFAVASTGGCFRAPAPGASWTAFTAGFEPLTDQTGNHFLAVAPSPAFAADGTVFVAAFEGLFGSTDRGETWEQGDVYSQRLSRALAISPDHARDGLLFAANYGGGPFVHRDPDTTWAAGGGCLPVEPVASGSAAPGAHLAGAASGMTAAAAPTRGTSPAAPVSAACWDARADDVASLYGSVIAVSPSFADDRTVFYGYVGLWRSRSAGRDWEALDAPVQIARAIALSPRFASDGTVFLGSSGEGTFRSDDSGASWSELTGGLPSGVTATRLVTSPGFPGDAIVLLSTAADGLWRSTDGGSSWSPAAGLATDAVRALAVSPSFATDRIALAGTVGGGLYRSTDGGASWQPANAGLPWGAAGTIESVAFSPAFAADATAFAVDAYDGVWRSTDGGLAWQRASEGLPVGAPRVLVVSPGFAHDRTLVLSTHDWLWRSRDAGASWERLDGYARVDDRHPAVRTGGAWTPVGAPGSHGPGAQRALAVGAWHELTFRGRDITWYTVRAPGAGSARVTLDGADVAVVDTAAAATEPQVAAFTRSFAAVGWHTIRITVATPGGVTTDGFEYSF